jgi:hypothetical protein
MRQQQLYIRWILEAVAQFTQQVDRQVLVRSLGRNKNTGQLISTMNAQHLPIISHTAAAWAVSAMSVPQPHVSRDTCPELQNDWTRDGADVEHVDCFHIHRAMARSHVALASLGMAQRHLLLHRARYQGTCEKGLLLCMIHPCTIIRLVGVEEIRFRRHFLLFACPSADKLL